MNADDAKSRKEWIKAIRARVNKTQEVQYRKFLQDFYLSSLLSRNQQKHITLSLPKVLCELADYVESENVSAQLTPNTSTSLTKNLSFSKTLSDFFNIEQMDNLE